MAKETAFITDSLPQGPTDSYWAEGSVARGVPIALCCRPKRSYCILSVVCICCACWGLPLFLKDFTRLYSSASTYEIVRQCHFFGGQKVGFRCWAMPIFPEI